MASETRYVFDSNTVVSALLFEKSSPGLALTEAFEQGNVIISMDVAEEMADVLRREKFDRYVGGKTREEFLRALSWQSVVAHLTLLPATMTYLRSILFEASRFHSQTILGIISETIAVGRP